MSCRSITDRLTCRQVLNIMVILGFMINFMVRVNLSIAITEMVVPHKSSQNSTLSNINDECSGPAAFTNNNNMQIKIPQSTSDINTSQLVDHKLTEKRPQTRYEWNEYEVNFILGAFFWGYFITEVPGGRLAEIIGGKRVFGYSTVTAGIITLFTPFAATFGYKVIAALRIIMGIMMGATWPAILPMSSRWIPPTERGKFVSNLMASSLGVAVTMPICGVLIASLGWESVFYFTGTITCIWSIVWFLIIYDSPAQHPRISDEERRYIEDALGATSLRKPSPVPWRSILTSKPIWAIFTIHCCNVFAFFTLLNQIPTYMKYILNYNINENGLLSALPYVGKYTSAILSAAIADYIYRKNKLSLTTTRKLFTFIGVFIPGICMIVLSQFGCNRLLAVTIFIFSLTVNGAVSPGYLANYLDISPNFSGTIYGVANTLSSFTGYLSSLMVGSLTVNNQTYAQWKIIFWILAGIYIFGTTVFLIFGSAKTQEWNNPDNQQPEKRNEIIDRKHKEEIMPLDELKVQHN